MAKAKYDFNAIKNTCGWKHERSLFNYLRGKSVIIVGPAEYLIGQNKGEWIDSFDVIVRLNLSCPVPKELHQDLGSRTDVLYHTLIRKRHITTKPDMFKQHDREEVINWKKDGVKWVVLKNNLEWLNRKGTDMKNFGGAIKGSIEWTNVSGYKYRQLTTRIRKGPNMGTVAIFHLLLANIKELHVIGCDFHKTGYYTGYGGFDEMQAKKGKGGYGYWGQAKSKRRIHNVDNQIEYLRDIYGRESKFKPDDALKKVLGV